MRMNATRLSFISALPPLGGWRLSLLAAGIATLLTAAMHWLTAWEAVQVLQGRIGMVQPRRAAPPPLPAAVQREQEQQLKVVTEAVRQLNLPVPRLLKTLQAPADMHVALLGLDLNGQPSQESDSAATAQAAARLPQGPTGSLNIAAEAETAQDMLNYLAFLNQQPLFRSVYLVKHELAGGGIHPYRFQLEAQWRQ
jgi:hypothetical protein